METLPVLVVGAGPVGLACAVILEHQGVRCRVIERSPEPSGLSKAGGIQARTLEILDELHLAEEFLARGVQIRASTVLHRGHALAEIDYGVLAGETRHPFVLGMPQSTTEGLLAARLERRGITVERGVALVECTQDDDGVTSTLEHADGRRETVRSRWLAGCDGPHSTVRDAFGIAFPGGDYPTSYALGDVDLIWDEPPDRAMLLLGERGSLQIYPIGAHRWRVAIDCGPLHGDERPRAPQREQLQELCDPYLPRPAEIGAVHWSTYYCIHHRHAETFRAGRAFLLGDAAHLHSPITFQGMNAGIQDAWNLGWKLACAERGAATDALLDSYDAERRDVDVRITHDSGEIERIFTVRRPLTRYARNVLFPFLASVPGYERTMARTTSQLRYGYRGSPAVARGARVHPCAGDLAPELPTTTDGGATIRDGRSYVSMLFMRSPAELASFRAPAWPTDGSVRVRTVLVSTHRDRGAAPGAAVIADPDDSLHRAWGAQQPTHVLVRPDGYVAWRGRPHAAEELAAHLERVHGARLGPVGPVRDTIAAST